MAREPLKAGTVQQRWSEPSASVMRHDSHKIVTYASSYASHGARPRSGLVSPPGRHRRPPRGRARGGPGRADEAELGSKRRLSGGWRRAGPDAARSRSSRSPEGSEPSDRGPGEARGGLLLLLVRPCERRRDTRGAGAADCRYGARRPRGRSGPGPCLLDQDLVGVLGEDVRDVLGARE
jgi:hypothetical protein